MASKQLRDCNHQVDDILLKDKATEEEFQNFMHQVTQVEGIVKKLSSCEIHEQKQGILLADEFLKCKSEVDENEELKVTSSRTVINKNFKSSETENPNEISKEIFMKTVEKDAKERYEDRLRRNERAETYKKIGINAFKEGDYEKAITYFGKGIEQRKDSAVLWNNRAVSYINLGLYEKALEDYKWTLKIDKSNLKALLNGAKCYRFLKDEEKCQEFLCLAKEGNPQHLSYIEEFEEQLYVKPKESV